MMLWSISTCRISLAFRTQCRFGRKVFLTTSLRPYLSLNANKPPRREDFYSLQDLHERYEQRGPPPSMDKIYEEEDGYGAHMYAAEELDEDYLMQQQDPRDSLDLYEKEAIRQQSQRQPTPMQQTRSSPTRQRNMNVDAARPRAQIMPPFFEKSNNRIMDDDDDFERIFEETPSAKPAYQSFFGIEEMEQEVSAPPPLPPPPPPVFSTSDWSNEDAKRNKYTPPSVESLQEQISEVTQQIYAINDGKEFNLNSSKQVAQALFGGVTQSTKKEILEGMATTNPMAALILKYRTLKNQMNKASRKQESAQKGTAVHDAMAVAKPAQFRSTRTNKSTNEDSIFDVVSPKFSGNEAGEEEKLQEELSDPLILLDASSYIFRAYYTMPAIHRADGMPTGAVMGFCKMLNSMFLDRMINAYNGNQQQQPRVVLCFDAKGKTFRHDLYPKYKGNRPAAPVDLIPQFDLVRQAAQAYGICQVEAPTYEADDVIATMATMALQQGMDTNILSGDKDLMQLITSTTATPTIQMIDPVKKDRTAYPQVVEKWNVPPEKLGDVLALAGDTADNIPGVPMIGPKIAATLINEFGSLDNLLANLDKIPQKKRRETLQANVDLALLSRELVQLETAVPLHAMEGIPYDGNIQEMRMEPLDVDRLLAFYDEMGFRELKRTLLQRVQGVQTKRSSFNRKPKYTPPNPDDYADLPF